jgi:hypothetical protein
MTQGPPWQFGLILAYLVPGFVGLAGLAPLVPAVARWLTLSPPNSLDLGPTFYSVLAATAIGMILSCFRWLLIDRIHLSTGLKRPNWNDESLHGKLASFDYLVQNHFRYYEFCGNTLLAVTWAYGVNRILGTSRIFGIGTDLAVLMILIVLFVASRDALANYYTRTALLLGEVAEKEKLGDNMFNGNDHGTVPLKPASAKSDAKRKRDVQSGKSDVTKRKAAAKGIPQRTDIAK